MNTRSPIITMFSPIACGYTSGLLLRLPFWNRPSGEQIHDDEEFWEIPDDGFPEVSELL